MPISTMEIIMISLLLIGGVGESERKKLGVTRWHGLFFLACALLLSGFSMPVSDEASVSPACILIGVWLFGLAFSGNGRSGRKLLVIPLSAALGLAFGALIGAPGEAEQYAIGAFAAPVSMIFGTRSALGFAGLTPLITAAGAYAYSSIVMGFGTLDIGEAQLSAQLAGVFFAFIGACLNKYIESYVRTRLSDDRPTALPR